MLDDITYPILDTEVETGVLEEPDDMLCEAADGMILEFDTVGIGEINSASVI